MGLPDWLIDIRQHFTVACPDPARDFFVACDTKIAGEFINIRKDNGPQERRWPQLR